MTRYAASTDVTAEKSRGEIERTLKAARAYDQTVRQRWRALSLVIKAKLLSRPRQLAGAGMGEFARLAIGHRQREADAAASHLEHHDCARGVPTVGKASCAVARLEAVESGITVFEEEFMAHIVLPNGQTVGEFMTPQIESAYRDGKMPPMLPAPK